MSALFIWVKKTKVSNTKYETDGFEIDIKLLYRLILECVTKAIV